jgi:uncharacterized iron-regulated membrane protein
MLLAGVMTVLALTGGFVAFKKELEYLQPATRSGMQGPIEAVLPPARIVDQVLAEGLPEARSIEDINRIELRPAKRIYKVRLEATDTWSSPVELQVDAITGEILNRGLRGDQLWMDIHSFAVFGTGIKLFTMVLAGLALLWLALSGLYLFFFPPWFRARKRRARERRKVVRFHGSGRLADEPE